MKNYFRKVLFTVLVFSMLVPTFASIAETNLQDHFSAYSIAEYDRYNSYASVNGLDGDLIQVKGIISEYVSVNNAHSFILTQSDGKQWVVGIGLDGLVPPDTFNGYEGKNVTVYGEYYGFSDVFSLPNISIAICGGFILEDSDLFVGTFASIDENLQEWMHDRAHRELFSYTNEYEYDLLVCEGIVTSATHYNTIDLVNISFTQDDGESYHRGSIQESYSDYPVLKEIDYGDNVELYYVRLEDGSFALAFIDSPADATVTLEAYQDEYKSKCKDYTYKGIARNPEKVKGEYAVVTGEVIQVLEDGNDVELRVNITKESWGYTDTIYVTYTRKSTNEDRILEDDIVTIWGTLEGLLSYDSTLGKQVTLPWLDAEYINIDSL